MAQLNANLVPGNINSTVLSNSTNAGPLVEANSLVKDASSSIPHGSPLQRSGSANIEPYLNLPSSPMSFSSNNLRTSVFYGNTVAQQSSHLDQGSLRGSKRQQSEQQAHTSQAHQVPGPDGIKQECGTSTQKRKKPRLDIYNEDVHQEIFQQLQRHDFRQLKDHNTEPKAIIQQNRKRNKLQQQISTFTPQLREVHVQQAQQQMQHHLQQQATDQVAAVHSLNGGVCSRRLMQFLYHLRCCPHDNSIAYWRKFVAEYYAPCAKKRWCLSLYENIGQHALGVFSQAAMEAWHCDICGSKSGKGFEAVFESLPRLNKIKRESGVLDELLFLDFPQECQLPSGVMVLEYGKAVQESVYEQFRVVREGKLRITFRHDLKILSWEFCARRHEELLLRRLVTPQVDQLIQAACKYRSSMSDGGSDVVSLENLQSNCSEFVTAGHKLASNLELSVVNDLGFSKRYVRCLQIAEVVDSMKELMTFSSVKNIGPIESLKNYPREGVIANAQMKGMQQRVVAQGMPTDRNRLASMHPCAGSHINDNTPMNSGVFSASVDMASSLTNCYQKLPMQNSANSTARTTKQEQPCPTRSAISSSSLGLKSSGRVLRKNSSVNGCSSIQPPQSNKNLQQRMINKLLQEMVANSGVKYTIQDNGKVKEVDFCELDVRPARGNNTLGGTGGFAKGTATGTDWANTSGSLSGSAESFIAASNGNSSGVCGNDISLEGEPCLPEFHLPEAFWDMARKLSENNSLRW